MRLSTWLKSRPNLFASVKSGSFRKYSYFLFLIPILLFALGGTANAQTLTVTTDYGATVVNNDDYLAIDEGPSMPDIELEVTGACGTVTYTVSTDWVGGDGSETSGQFSDTFPCGVSGNLVDWSLFGSFEGGSVDIDWYVTSPNGTTSPSQAFNFFILGENPCYFAVDSVGAYTWFFPNILSEESSYRQFSAGTNCPGTSNNGDPLFGTPGGYGLAQLEAPSRATGDDDFWSWIINEQDGELVLATKQAGAYNHWQAQLSNWIADGSSPAVPATYGSYCAFQYPQGGGDYYGDADWIHAYNGYYYTLWVRPTPGNPGFWSMDGYNHSGYVQNVCNSTPH